jgi:hypothetical protein
MKKVKAILSGGRGALATETVGPVEPMVRIHQIMLIAAVMALAWLWMQVVHELGHCLGAWATSGKVEKVVLHPLAISRTDVAPNPRPLIVVWAGPVAGVILPILFWAAAALLRWPGAWLARFFAGFCLLANGLYIGIGSFEQIGDAGDMIRHGSPVWTLWLFGLVTAPAGLALWNGLGRHFGFGPNPSAIDRKAAYGCMALLLATVMAECLLSSTS